MLALTVSKRGTSDGGTPRNTRYTYCENSPQHALHLLSKASAVDELVMHLMHD